MTKEQEAQPTQDAPKKGNVIVELTRAYWPAEDQRLPEGTKVEVSREEAGRLIEAGVATRTDPLP